MPRFGCNRAGSSVSVLQCAADVVSDDLKAQVQNAESVT